ncbi:hypothetical protein [Pelagicoccus mobilis]|uniref:Nucleotidyl transferase AbiEii toxin, Type IV TA system n=1 Tax=Pelagicoccus mobilis TaxID=415221 RepID=A0A934VP86_9BACT|nr:hypothetical protein [Pelagicoccus mobilis]MBK1880731.1 hypothetical protein [Pelagicoccus mobilis]
MAEIPFASLKGLAREFDELQIEYAFTGGSIAGLLLDSPELTPMRPTDDVDVIVEVLSRKRYPEFEQRLRDRGFENDARLGAPMCRWVFNTLTVDLMPTDGTLLGLNTIWFDYALATAVDCVIDGESIKVVSAPAFIATKLAAFSDRGEGDYYGSHDLEDIITVVDGRAALVKEVGTVDEKLRTYVRTEVANLLADPDFEEALPAHLPPDSGSQARLPQLLEKLNTLAGL